MSDRIAAARGETARLRGVLRAHTDPRHRALEDLPFFQALARGTPDPAPWAGYLDALAMIYGALDEARPPGVAPYPLGALEADRVSARDRAGPEPLAPLARVRAQLLAHRIRSAAAEDPVELAGIAWVLEGAARGAALLRSRLGAEGLESRWHEALSRRDREGWSAFLTPVEGLPLASEPGPRMALAADGTFLALARIGRALDPLLEGPGDGFHDGILHELNPHAGTHPVPADPEVVEAALRVGEASWNRWPYYRARYGERGRAFTRSDSAWLASLGASDGTRGLEQVVWLADLLAQRGMPRILMEEHLARLAEGLGPAHPATPLLGEARRLLARRRSRWVPDRVARGVARRFDDRVPPAWARRHPRTGLLLASALADEADGLDRAVSSLVDWFGDPTRFPPGWVAEVKRTVTAGRKRIRGLRREAARLRSPAADAPLPSAPPPEARGDAYGERPSP